jgi:hypothetical protein
MPARRFPPPWSVEELDACFAVRDANGQALAYAYFEDEPGRRSTRPAVAEQHPHGALDRAILAHMPLTKAAQPRRW